MVDDRPYPQSSEENQSNRFLIQALNETLFTSLTHARQILADWEEDYNTVRPRWQDTGSGRQIRVSGACPPRRLPSHQPQTIKTENSLLSGNKKRGTSCSREYYHLKHFRA
ncbi:integrase core domain-containing protein [Komagataeibacter saccharivorans]|uniref:integrase core domain-containing protein n=1 Tax=Komagataeibacter saccharivorans TaxID=265959 RepID=UPI0038CFC262